MRRHEPVQDIDQNKLLRRIQKQIYQESITLSLLYVLKIVWWQE